MCQFPESTEFTEIPPLFRIEAFFSLSFVASVFNLTLEDSEL